VAGAGGAAAVAERKGARLAAVSALAWVALAGAAGCTGRAAGERAAPSSPSPSVSASPSRDPLASQICGDLRQKVLDRDTRAFGAALGRKVATHAAGDKAAEAQAGQAAVTTVKQVAGSLRTEAITATEPGLQQALTASAANLDTLAADPSAVSGLTSLDQVTGLTGRFTTALAPISDYCAAA
jgi:hypothetical protein